MYGHADSVSYRYHKIRPRPLPRLASKDPLKRFCRVFVTSIFRTSLRSYLYIVRDAVATGCPLCGRSQPQDPSLPFVHFLSTPRSARAAGSSETRLTLDTNIRRLTYHTTELPRNHRHTVMKLALIAVLVLLGLAGQAWGYCACCHRSIASARPVCSF